jgi:hypothetical protein
MAPLILSAFNSLLRPFRTHFPSTPGLVEPPGYVPVPPRGVLRPNG